MARTSLCRRAIFGVALALSIVGSTAASPAAIDMGLGDRRTVSNQPLNDCYTRAQAALTTTLQRPDEINPGEWKAYAPVEAPATPPAAASIHCFPLGSGYFVTFECAVEIPPSTTTAADLCTKLSAAFDAKQAAQSSDAGTGGKR